MWRWCGSPDGLSSAAVASVLAKLVRGTAGSAIASTANVKDAACDSPPLVPCAEIASLPAVAEAPTPKMIETGLPGATVNGLGGFVLTPAARPVKVTCTVPVNPFSAVTLTLTPELEEPCATDTEFGDIASTKSGEGGGGTMELLPPPQPAQAASSSAAIWTLLTVRPIQITPGELRERWPAGILREGQHLAKLSTCQVKNYLG
jgi:hypothetical protein